MLREIIPSRFFIATVSILIVSSTISINSQVKTGSKPGWIIEIKSDTSLNNLSEDSYGGYYYLLKDIQENISEETIYCHYAIKLFNNDGVQNMSDISVDFDPGFQTLRFHEINRFRNGVKTNELLTHKIKIIQREPEMERFLYDGRITAYRNLEDIREGDIIEYSYSLVGYNPIYKGQYFNNFNLEYTKPLKEIYERIISPKNMKLFLSYPSGIIEPAIQHKNNSIVYIWHSKEVKPHSYDNNVPAWYNNNLRVEVSSYNNWSDVVKLCLFNYQVPDTEQTKLKKMADELLGNHDKDSLLMPVIRFIQDKIRYLGFEAGLNAYKPMDPVTVMKSRYADCKAKSLLLCSLLKLYGIEAYPVLVNSDQIKYENQVSPSPDVFNHTVVQIVYNNKVYYIDPTISNQGGSIDNYYFPNYGYGLILKEGTTSLIPLVNNSISEIRVKNYFKTDSMGGTVSYKVSTEYSGHFADDNRSSFQINSDDETAKEYLKFYSKTYPLIKSTAPLKYKDDRNNNIFTVEEEYQIDSMWVPKEGDHNKIELTLAALIINSAVSIPASPERKMPYFISFPTDYTEDIYIDLPVESTVTPKKIEIKDSVFSFLYSSEYKDKKIHLHYNYKTFCDYQAANTFKEFYSKNQKISDNIYYSLTYTKNDSTPFKFSWTVACCYIIILTVCITLAFRIYRNFNLPVTTAESREIGGWLVLIAIGLVISSIGIVYNFYFGSNYFNKNIWSVYLKSSDPNIPSFLLMCFEFIYFSILLVYLILLQFLFYKKRNILPMLIIILYAGNLLFLILDYTLAHAFSPGSYSLVEKNRAYLKIGRCLVSAIIWITYFIKSKRVKATFTRVSLGSKDSIIA